MPTVRLLAALVTGLLLCEGGHAQDAKVWRIGFLSPYSSEHDKAWRAGFEEGLRELGYIPGKNVSIELRYAQGALDRLPALAAELVKLKVDLLLAHGTISSTHAAREARGAIPIVFVAHPDPVGLGLVTNLSRPGGNITGISDLHTALGAKRLELLKEMVPTASRIGIVLEPTVDTYRAQLKDAISAAPSLRLTAVAVEVRGPEDFDTAFSRVRSQRLDALNILGGTLNIHARRFADLAIKHGIPTIATTRLAAEEGMLMSYGASFPALYRRAARYVDRIFKGARAGDLAIEQPTQFELVINSRTARAMGIAVPQSLALRADAVVER